MFGVWNVDDDTLWYYCNSIDIEYTFTKVLEMSDIFSDLRVDGGDNRGGTQPSWANNYHKQGGRCL